MARMMSKFPATPTMYMTRKSPKISCCLSGWLESPRRMNSEALVWFLLSMARLVLLGDPDQAQAIERVEVFVPPSFFYTVSELTSGLTSVFIWYKPQKMFSTYQREVRVFIISPPKCY